MKKSIECPKSSSSSQLESQTIAYLLSKEQSPTRKPSVESDSDRPNFCCRVNSIDYTVTRGFAQPPTSKFVKLYYTKFTPKKKKAQICIVHGYGQTTDDYLTVNIHQQQMAEHFAQEGCVINMIDMRGFGYSGGSRANQPIREVLSDIQYLLTSCCQRELETFIVAQGIGAMFVNALLQQNPRLPISGVIFISPIMNFTNPNKNSYLHKFVVKFHPQIFDHLQIASSMNATALAKKPELIKKKIQSCFSTQFLTLKMANQYNKISQKVRQQAYKFCYPLLICRGSNDFLQEEKPIIDFLIHCSSEQKQLKVFKDGYHSLHCDYEADDVRSYMKQWMKKRKENILWKKMKPFNLDRVIRKNYFGRFILILIGFMVTLITTIKRIKKYIRCN